jgi:excisionase family DNA binding protein
MDTDCLTIKEVADRLQVSAATVYHLCAQRKLAHVRVGAKGGAIRIREQDLREFLASRQVGAGERPDGQRGT